VIDDIMQVFSYGFMCRAFMVGIAISICSALLGVPLVLKRFSMMGDGLSHVAFGTLSIAMATHDSPLLISLPIVILCSFLLLNLSQKSKLHGDAAIALISTSSLSIGVLVLSVTTGMNTDVCNFLFGSILGMSNTDVYVSLVMCAVILIAYILMYQRIFATTFDEAFAKASGINVKMCSLFISLMMSIIIVLGMRMMGALLISNLIVIPALTSMRIFKTFFSAVLYAVVISVICFSLGMVTSYLIETPTGASIVIFNIVAFILHAIIGSTLKYVKTTC